jgi:hypothetical protein
VEAAVEIFPRVAVTTLFTNITTTTTTATAVSETTVVLAGTVVKNWEGKCLRAV